MTKKSEVVLFEKVFLENIELRRLDEEQWFYSVVDDEELEENSTVAIFATVRMDLID